jgi:carboxyl-terminal processing protease
MVTASVIIGISIGLLVQPLISGDNIFKQVKKFDYVLNTAYKNYVEEIDTQQLVEAAIKGMLNELDPHSVYISADEMKHVNEEFQGSFEGIGVEFDVINDTITVVAPITGGPSEMLGIQSGDKIVKIDGKTAVGIDRADVPKKLKGPKGTIVELDIHRDREADLLHFAVTRDKIPLYTVDSYYMIDGTDIGVVAVNRFAATTLDETKEAIRNLKNQGMKKLVLDLRGNPGGYLNQAYMVAEQFLPRGDTIVYTKGRTNSFDEVYISTANGEFINTPLIVMVNEGSASASEIVTGAMQDLDRGLVVGETSYGKGLVQRQYPVEDGSAFRITIAKYYTPSGRCIQRPYKDKDKYRHMLGRLELSEGSYLVDPLGKISKQVEELNAKAAKGEDKINMDSLPIFHTLGGRTVFGGGGITPDYIVKSDTITGLSVQIRRKNLFFEFVNDYMKDEIRTLKGKYENDFSAFFRNYNISDKMLADFKKLAVAKGVIWDDKQYDIDKDFYKIAIKATVARDIWDRNRMVQVYSSIDRQLMKAADLFPDAQKISKNNR